VSHNFFYSLGNFVFDFFFFGILIFIGQRALEGNEYTKWGHEYLQQLSADVSTEHEKRLLEDKSTDDILIITEKIVRHFANHNSEMEAID